MVDPQPFPDWMSEEDLQVYVEAFRSGGFRGPLNRYRAVNLDFHDLAEIAEKSVMQPSYFIAGERGAVRSFIPGMDLYADPAIACTDFRGQAILPGVGHWVQQEAPDEVNRALLVPATPVNSTHIPCHVIWRLGERIGVAFD